MKIKIIYPETAVRSLELVVSEEFYENIQNMCIEEKADFIYKAVQEDSYENAGWTSRKLIMGALDTDYATIKKI